MQAEGLRVRRQRHASMQASKHICKSVGWPAGKQARMQVGGLASRQAGKEVVEIVTEAAEALKRSVHTG